MPYNADLNRIKQATHTELTNTDFDIKLGEARDKAYNFMNTLLEGAGATVPLTGLNAGDTKLIQQIEADMAAGFFKEETTEPIEGERVKKHILRERAEQMLTAFMATKYQGAPKNRANQFRHGKNRTRFKMDQSDEDIVEPYYSREI
jgi:hypothetical protein